MQLTDLSTKLERMGSAGSVRGATAILEQLEQEFDLVRQPYLPIPKVLGSVPIAIDLCRTAGR